MIPVDLMDRLTVVQHLVEAAFMATADLSLGDQRPDALRTVLGLAGSRLDEIKDELETIRAEPRRMVGGERCD